jgi:hypothetical protein
MRRITSLLLAAFVALFCASAEAKVKIKVQRDKQFNFKVLRTYSWHPSGGGEVKVLEATGDDPAKLQAALDPLIRQAVEQGLAARGLTPAPPESADVHVSYYLLVGAGITSQHMGQFVGAVPEWGLPPFEGATTSLKIYEQGSLVLDVASRQQKSVVWRGTAAAEVDRQRDEASRNERVRKALLDMLRKFPS